MKNKIKKGDRVIMSDCLKKKLYRDCQVGKHVKPQHENDGEDCIDCSINHVLEFGGCIGIVGDPINCFGHFGPEVEVSWQPDNLKYCYHPDDLEIYFIK